VHIEFFDNPVYGNQGFGGICYLHLHGRNKKCWYLLIKATVSLFISVQTSDLWTFTALMTYLIHNAIILQCHTFIADIKQMQRANVPDRQKRINHQLQQILFSLSRVLATCFRLNQSVMQPLYETNSKYNKITRQHMVCGIPHQNYHYSKNINSKRCGIPQKNTTQVPYVHTSLHYTCYLSGVRA